MVYGSSVMIWSDWATLGRCGGAMPTWPFPAIAVALHQPKCWSHLHGNGATETSHGVWLCPRYGQRCCWCFVLFGFFFQLSTPVINQILNTTNTVLMCAHNYASKLQTVSELLTVLVLLLFDFGLISPYQTLLTGIYVKHAPTACNTQNSRGLWYATL